MQLKTVKSVSYTHLDRYQSCAELLYALDHYQDLDIENKKVQSLKWKTFIASVRFKIAKSFS